MILYYLIYSSLSNFASLANNILHGLFFPLIHDLIHDHPFQLVACVLFLKLFLFIVVFLSLSDSYLLNGVLVFLDFRSTLNMVVTKILAIQSLKTFLKSALWGKICIFLVLGVEDKLLFALCYLYIANSVKLEKFIEYS